MSQEVIEDRPLQIAVLTVSDTRIPANDKGGDRIVDLALEAGLVLLHRALVKDDLRAIQDQLKLWLADDRLDAVITTGGTGIAQRDVTIEAIWPLLDKEIPGFGELFRYLSFTEDIGSRAIASRALAGVTQDVLIFTLPGSVGAVTLAMKSLILPEISHLVREITK